MGRPSRARLLLTCQRFIFPLIRTPVSLPHCSRFTRIYSQWGSRGLIEKLFVNLCDTTPRKRYWTIFSRPPTHYILITRAAIAAVIIIAGWTQYSRQPTNIRNVVNMSCALQVSLLQSLLLQGKFRNWSSLGSSRRVQDGTVMSSIIVITRLFYFEHTMHPHT